MPRVAHKWERHPDSETVRRPFQRWRICILCKQEQQHIDHQEWGRIVSYSWWPLVGRCPGKLLKKKVDL